MKIICEYGNISHPYAATLQYCGHEVLFWTPNKPLLDIYDETKPDLILFENKDKYLELPYIKCLTYQLEQKNLANPVQLIGYAEEKYECDVIILDDVLPPIVSEFATRLFRGGLRVKIFAGNVVGSPYHLGVLTSYKEYANAIASSKFVLDITDRWDFNVWMNGKICLKYSENEDELRQDPVYNTIEEAIHSCRHLLDNTKKYDSLVKINKKRAIQNTYFQETSNILSKLELAEESEKITQVFDEKIRNLLR